MQLFTNQEKNYHPKSRLTWLNIFTLLLCCCCGLSTPAATPVKSAAEREAAQILAIPGLRPGIVADIGCGNGEMAIALARGGVRLVHGLASDDALADAARRGTLEASVAGQVTIERQSGARLPYADDLLNVIVVEQYAAQRRAGLTLGELWRVLAPYNTLVLGGVEDEGALRAELAQLGCAPGALHEKGQWRWVGKPLPATMDEWPQRYHDAGNSRVSHDQLVGPATGFRWIQGPIWGYSPTGSLGQEVLVADGRAFYVEKSLPDKLTANLVVRDAFNGLQLWTRSIVLDKANDTEWATADGERLFTRISPGGPVVALDAATGKLLWSSKFHGAFCCSDGLLLIRAAINQWVALSQQNGKLVHRFQVANSYHDAEMLAGDGMLLLLEAGPAESADAKHLDDPVWRTALLKQTGAARGKLVCFDLQTGALRWKAPNTGNGWPYWLCKGLVMTRNMGGQMQVFSTKDGAYRWSQLMGTKMFGFTAAFYMQDAIWGYQAKSWLQQYDPATGKVLKVDSGRWKEFGRCAADLATERWYLGQEMQITDLASGRTYDQDFTRAACATGYTPADGLLLNHTHTCACADYIRGVQGICCTPSPATDIVGDLPCEHGPAYGQALPDAGAAADDWPTYRHDPFRSGGCLTPVNAAAHAQWSTLLSAPLSAPVVANGVVYLACVEQQRVVALDARQGKLLWDYPAGGRIDTPPTVYHGMVLFGCHDGWLYALRATDGLLIWRVRLAPEARYISVRDRLESAWPLFGAVLVDHDVIWAAAGRHGDADGGVWVATLDPASGRVLWHDNIHGFPPYRTDSTLRLIEARGKIPDDPTPAAMAAADPELVAGLDQRFANDVLISNGKTIFLGGLGLDALTHQAGPPVGQALYTHGLSMPVDNMLWGVYWNRLDWTFAGKVDAPSWQSIKPRDAPSGNLIVLGGGNSYTVNFPNSVSAHGAHSWSVALSGKWLIVKALVVAGDRLVVACRLEGATPSSSVGDLRILSTVDGHELGRTLLPAPVRYDGLAIGSGILVASLEDGTLQAFPVQPAQAAPPVLATKPAAAAPPSYRPIAVVLPPDDARYQLLETKKLPITATPDLLAALADTHNAVVVAGADPATLALLATATTALEAFTARGGWLLLWGLDAAGLPAFNNLVGVEHLWRPVENEKISLVHPTGLLAGLSNDDLWIDGKDTMLLSGQHAPAGDAWYGALDYDDIAPFATLPAPDYWGRPDGKPNSDRWPRNMVNGFTDEFWQEQFVMSLDQNAHTSFPMRLPHQETVVGFSVFPGPYGQVRRIRLVSDLAGVPPAEIQLAAKAGRQDFTIRLLPAKTITVELVDWEPSVMTPILSIANMWVRVARSDDFRRRVQPLLNPGVLMAYPRGAGGLLLCQLCPLPADKLLAGPDNPADLVKLFSQGEQKKRNIMTRLLENLSVTPITAHDAGGK